jgi:Kef-type K+ transport system membrane component KefB
MENNSIVALLLALGILVASARLAGGLARRFQQPRVLGELIVGVLLGPTLLNVLNSSSLGLQQAHLDETISHLAELGVLLLMFKVGLEVHVAELVKVGLVAVLAGVLGALLPVLMTLPLVMLFNYTWEPALFAGVTLAATSVSISAQVLLELDVLKTKVGNGLLATALVDDVVAILLVSLTIAITGPRGEIDPGTLVSIIGRMVIYLVVSFLVAWFIVPRLMNWIHNHPEASQSFGIPAFALIFALLFGWSAQVWGGIASITGAFIVGLGLSRTHPAVKHQIEEAVNNIAYAFLVPIFFVSVGLHTDLSRFPLDALPLAITLLIIAAVSKILGCGVGARVAGFTNHEAYQLGICMISRGEVGLIIVSLGLSSGILTTDDPLFASLFLVILLTTVVTPPLVRRAFAQPSVASKPSGG